MILESLQTVAPHWLLVLDAVTPVLLRTPESFTGTLVLTALPINFFPNFFNPLSISSPALPKSAQQASSKISASAFLGTVRNKKDGRRMLKMRRVEMDLWIFLSFSSIALIYKTSAI